MTANGKKTVLLVEDNEDNRIVYSTILRHFGYSVTEALNGEEGIAKAKSEKPDLILMDISIPIIDGWEATQVWKHDPETSTIPIIALTAHALASDREKAMEVGCDGYLAKPCEPRAVVAAPQEVGREVEVVGPRLAPSLHALDESFVEDVGRTGDADETLAELDGVFEVEMGFVFRDALLSPERGRG